MSAYRIARRYAAALLMLSQEQGVDQQVADDARTIRGLGAASAPFRNLLRSPIIYRDKKQRILHRIFEGRIHDLTMQFIDILLRKRRENYMLAVFDAYLELFKAEKKIADVMVYLPVEGVESVRVQLETWVRNLPPLRDKQQIHLHTAVDTELIGGFVLEFEGYKLDQSVRTQLDSFRKSFTVS